MCDDHREECVECGIMFDTRTSGYEDKSRCGPCWNEINNRE